MNDRVPPALAATLAGIVVLITGPAAADDQLLGNSTWKRNGFATQRFDVQGTGGRNNPLRRKLTAAFSGDELFVRFRIRYDAATIDSPPEDSGEFLVLWLDDAEGSDGSTHSAGVPNAGIHVSGNDNRFMVRYGPSAERFGRKLEGDRDFLVIARLGKSVSGSQEPFDQLSLWVDPGAAAEFQPDASTSSRKSITAVNWIGFSTGAKTEIDDRIELWDIGLARSWQQILGLPIETEPDSAPLTEQPRTIDFAQHVYPILKSRCFQCHAGEEAKQGVRLDVWDEVLNQTTPRQAASSHLFQLVTDGEMPPEGDALTPEELAVLSTWIDEGVQWDESLLPTPIPMTDHWAFQPLRRPAVPEVRNSDWIRTPVDAFIARRHEERGLTPSPPASSVVLRRRLSLDLLGLPPSESSESDSDDLLGDPAYGERWGRHWLDVARWAESNGHQHNRHRPYAWRYRDWVIDAFNTDKPFADFVRQQIAGDELQPYSAENLTATGFLGAARYSGNELDKQIQRNDILVDITNTTAKAFLGLTLECAQCHTHKFDPLSIRDYYRFQAFFAAGRPGNVVLNRGDERARGLIEERWQIFDSVHARLVAVKRKQGHPEPIYVIPKSVVAGMKPKEKTRFAELETQIARIGQVWGFCSSASSDHSWVMAPHEMRWPLPRDPQNLAAIRTHLLIRGDVKSPGPEVTAGWPAVFGATPQTGEQPRTALAAWLTSRSNPLTARVWVNRVWQWHFGSGLVESSSDFGTQGSTASHPELLDYLASELIDSGWSTKHLHRLIVQSATYRQASQFSAANGAIDPKNRFLWRWTPRRLEAEAIRDSVLLVSGQLDAARGGESVDTDSHRRSIYLRQRRDHLPHQQSLFDGAGGVVSCARRRVSTTALQPLWMMNSELMQQAAEDLAQRSGSVEAAIRLALGRPASEEEVEILNSLAGKHGLPSVCLAILNSSEFLYIP
jgi:hypothetical protein